MNKLTQIFELILTIEATTVHGTILVYQGNANTMEITIAHSKNPMEGIDTPDVITEEVLLAYNLKIAKNLLLVINLDITDEDAKDNCIASLSKILE